MNDSGCKVVAVGDMRVGKTAMYKAIIEYHVAGDDYTPTIFDNYELGGIACTYCGKNHNLSLWDTSGNEEYDRLRPLSYPQTQIVLLCFSLDNPASLDSIASKWKQEVEHFIPETPCILVGLKSDSILEESIAPKKLQQIVTTAEAKRYFECSNLTGKGIRDLIDYLVLFFFHKDGLDLPPQLHSAKKQQCCIY